MNGDVNTLRILVERWRNDRDGRLCCLEVDETRAKCADELEAVLNAKGKDEMNRPEKTCLNCEHMKFDLGSPGYSEDPPDVGCRLKHWDGSAASRKRFAEFIETAKTCADFKREW